MQDVRRFPASPSSVTEVRTFVTEAARVETSHPAALVASELATNAIIHAQAPFTVSVQRVHGLVQIEVSDTCLQAPEPGLSELHGGLGLRIVQEMSKTWGTRFDDQGKTVWAAVPRREYLGR